MDNKIIETIREQLKYKYIQQNLFQNLKITSVEPLNMNISSKSRQKYMEIQIDLSKIAKDEP